MIVEDVKSLEKVDFTKLEFGNHAYFVQVPLPFNSDSDCCLELTCRYMKAIQDKLAEIGITNVILFPVRKDERFVDIKELTLDKTLL